MCCFQKLGGKRKFSESFGISPNDLLLTAVPFLVCAGINLKLLVGKEQDGGAAQEPV